MTAAVIVLAVAVVGLAVLVAGVLRTQAELLRALHDLGIRVDGEGVSTIGSPDPGIRTVAGVPGPADRRSDGSADVQGETPTGAAVAIGIRDTAHQTLLVFLSSGCLTCRNHWDRLRTGDLGLPDSIRPVVVTKDPAHDSPAAIARLAPDDVAVVMSTAAWDAYDVPVSPYFVLVDGPTNRVLGEGAAAEWDQMRDLMVQAVEDQGLSGVRTRPGAQGRRDADADDALDAAGIQPGDPRLFHEPDQR